MSAFPNSPRLIKGGIVLLDPETAEVRRIVSLQYNPDTLTRTLQPQVIKESGDRSEVLRLTGPPVETIKLGAKIEAMKGRYPFPKSPRVLKGGIVLPDIESGMSRPSVLVPQTINILTQQGQRTERNDE